MKCSTAVMSLLAQIIRRQITYYREAKQLLFFFQLVDCSRTPESWAVKEQVGTRQHKGIRESDPIFCFILFVAELIGFVLVLPNFFFFFCGWQAWHRI